MGGAGIAHRLRLFRTLEDPGLGRIPVFLRHDPELGDRNFDDLLLRRDGDLALAGLGIVLAMRLPQPRDPDVEGVAQEAVVAGDVAAQHGLAPLGALRRGDAVAVEALDDVRRRLARGGLAEDPAHDLGLLRVDLAVHAGLALLPAITIGEAVEPLAGLQRGAAPAFGMDRDRLAVELGAITQKQDLHEVLLALGDREELHTLKLEHLELAQGIDDAPGHAVDGHDDDDVGTSLSDLLPKGLKAGTAGVLAGHLGVGMNGDDGPSLVLAKPASHCDLIVERGRLLAVARVAGIDRGAGHWSASLVWLAAVSTALAGAALMLAARRISARTSSVTRPMSAVCAAPFGVSLAAVSVVGVGACMVCPLGLGLRMQG
nr:hypothetical protein [Acidimangrovimonas sediminis]